jgi:hypothetical protein
MPHSIKLAVLVRRAALSVLAIAALCAASAGPAQARPIGRCDGPCPKPPTQKQSDPRRCADCNSGATNYKEKQNRNQNQKLVRVYRSTRAYSTPYLDALKSRPLAATSYVAICEANSGSRGRTGNPWWSRLADGYWVNNGDLKGPARMGIGTCAPPPNDAQPSRGGRKGCDDCNVPPPPKRCISPTLRLYPGSIWGPRYGRAEATFTFCTGDTGKDVQTRGSVTGNAVADTFGLEFSNAEVVTQRINPNGGRFELQFRSKLCLPKVKFCKGGPRDWRIEFSITTAPMPVVTIGRIWTPDLGFTVYRTP